MNMRANSMRGRWALLLGVALLGSGTAGGQSAGTCAIHRQDLVAPVPQQADLFGSGVDLDGDFLVVGARRDDYGGLTNPGAVYTFERTGASWTLEAHLTPSDAHNGIEFGREVAIDGDRLVATGGGAVYVFRRSGPLWVEEARMVGSDQVGGADSVAIAGDTVLLGSYTSYPSYTAAVYVFQRTGSGWIEQQKLVAPDAAPGDAFGRSVAIDANSCVVGASLDDGPGGVDQGSAWVFVRRGSSWSPQAFLTASDANGNDRFGASVALQGGTIVVGSPWKDQGGARTGAAYVFVHDGVSWVQQAQLGANPQQADAQFGRSVAIDGDSIVVGVEREDASLVAAGAAYVFERTGSSWSQVARLENPTPSHVGLFGTAVAIDGEHVVVGEPRDGTVLPKAGSAQVFFVPRPPATYCTAKVNSLGCVPRLTHAGAPSQSDPTPFQIRAENLLPDERGLLLYGFRKANVNFHGGKQCVRLPLTRAGPPVLPGAIGPPPCTGVLVADFNSRIQSGSDPLLTTGQTVFAQWVQEDSADPTGFGDSLTAGLRFSICP